MNVLQEIEHHRPHLQELCLRLGIPGLRARLGSDDWTDVTFIGDIDATRLKGYAGRFFDLEDGLVRIFHRRIHLLDEEGIRLARERNAATPEPVQTEVELLHAS